jgi:hypothetical protein
MVVPTVVVLRQISDLVVKVLLDLLRSLLVVNQICTVLVVAMIFLLRCPTLIYIRMGKEWVERILGVEDRF